MAKIDMHITRHLKLDDVDAFYSIQTKELTELPFYLVSLGKHENEKVIHRPTGTPEHLLMYTHSGSGKVVINDVEHPISPGNLLYFPPYTTQYYFVDKSPWKLYWVAFNGSSVKKLLDIPCGVYSYGNPESFIKRFHKLFTLPMNVFWANKSSVLLYDLLLNCKNNIPANGLPSPQLTKAKLAAVIDYLNENFHRELSLDTIANLIGVSPTHLCRLFKNAYSLRPFEYINFLRIRRAKELMINQPQKNLSEISMEVGFNNVSYFLSVFKKLEKITPGEFRVQNSI